MDRNEITEILKDEIVVAMGCTEPAAAALAGSAAGELLGEEVVRARALVSRDIAKNAMGVAIPNSGKVGVQAAVALGLVIADTSSGLALLNGLTDEMRAKAAHTPVELEIVSGVPALYIRVEAEGKNHKSVAVVAETHTKFALLSKDGVVIKEDGTKHTDECSSTVSESLKTLSLKDILDYAKNVPSDIRALLLRAKDINLTISFASLDKGWGLEVGRTMFGEIGVVKSVDDAFRKGAALAAGGSDARMGGSVREVMINSGSGNQGITVTVPVAVLAEYLKSGEDKLVTALCISELTGLVLTSHKDRLSALCGAFTASIGTACAYVYLLGGDVNQMDKAVRNMVGNLSGIICDGAKNTCPLKIYSSVTAAGLAAHLAMKDLAPTASSGICGSDSLSSIGFLSRLSREGMEETDKTILNIMLDKGK
jgi:Uncharacterized conserved protein